MLDGPARRYLLGLARRVIAAELGVDSGRAPMGAAHRGVEEHRGAFVTLHVDGDLRGCIGFIRSEHPLREVVRRAATTAAFSDERFASIDAVELDRLIIEISVLGLPRRVERAEEVEVGKHGIIVSQAYQRGLLLPQVPIEHGWDRDEFLAHGCMKAGLPPDAWQKGATIEVFEAEVFSEEVSQG